MASKGKKPKVPAPPTPAEPEGEEASDEAAEPDEPSVEELTGADEPESSTAPRALARREEKGLASTDPLQWYLNDIGQHALLTREEEHALAVRYRDTGDVQAAYRLVAANLRLVVKLANEYHRNPISLLDLIQEGNIGLMQAVRKYDPDRGVKLSSYAAWWIRAYILRYIMDNWKMVKLGTTEAQRKLFFKLRQEQQRLTQQGFEVTPKLLAERLNVTEQDVVEMDQRLSNDELSLDLPVGDDGKGGTRGERIAAQNALPADEAMAADQLKDIFRTHIGEFAKTLKDKERYIFEKRLMADEPMTLQEIGTHYGVSRERARQLEAALIARMKAFMRERIPDFDLVAAPGE
jgi:RNA polymerase sigma-32 factor